RALLRRHIRASGGLRSRLTTTAQIGPDLEGQSVCLVGLLSDIRLMESGESSEPAGGASNAPTDTLADTLAVSLVEDLEGEAELVAFPPNYKRYGDLWTENNLVIVTARVCKHPDEEGVYLLCEQLAPYHADVE